MIKSESEMGRGRKGSESTDASYEAPRLESVGNLHDLLAHLSGSQCDETNVSGTGTDINLCA